MSRVIRAVDTEITPSAEPPITVPYARTHIKALGSQEDELIESWILAAGQYIEGQTGRQLITATRELWLDGFPCGTRIELPRPPLQGVVSVLYVDGDGTLQAFSDGASPEVLSYQVKAPAGTYARRGWLEPVSGISWPSTRVESAAVRIQYTAGYGDSPDDIPALLRGAICYLVSTFDRYRSPLQDLRFVDLPLGVQKTLEEFKYSALPSIEPRTLL